jgi:hypothetical protein
MTIRCLAVALALGLLASCGADGQPERPDPRPQTGISVSGSVEVGVTGGD